MSESGVVVAVEGIDSTLVMFQVINLVILLGATILAVYIAVLLIKYLRRGIRAFEVFIDNYEE